MITRWRDGGGNKGWSVPSLPTVGDNPEYWSAAEAAQMLGGGDLDARDVRNLVHLAHIAPVGKRWDVPQGKGGRHALVYNATDLIQAFDALHRLVE